jgi:hypothetical protein
LYPPYSLPGRVVVSLYPQLNATGRLEVLIFVGSANDHIHISALTLTPDPPVIGKNVTIFAKGTLGK